MADEDKKISELTNIGAVPESGDEFAINDVSAGTTGAVTWGNMSKGVQHSSYDMWKTDAVEEYWARVRSTGATTTNTNFVDLFDSIKANSRSINLSR